MNDVLNANLVNDVLNVVTYHLTSNLLEEVMNRLVAKILDDYPQHWGGGRDPGSGRKTIDTAWKRGITSL